MNEFRLSVSLCGPDEFSQTLPLLYSSSTVCADRMPQPRPAAAVRLSCDPIGSCPRACCVRVSVRRQRLTPQQEVQVVLEALAPSSGPVRVTPDDGIVEGYHCGALTARQTMTPGVVPPSVLHDEAIACQQRTCRLPTLTTTTTTKTTK